MKEQLVLFSGGLDSTVLLKFLLQENKNPITVLNIRYLWKKEFNKNYKIQHKIVKKLIKYFKKNYRDFNYREICFTMGNTPFIDFEVKLGEDHFSAILAGSYIAQSNKEIKDVWMGHFTYNDLSAIQLNKRVNWWFFDNSLNLAVNSIPNICGIKNINICSPSLAFKGNSIDSFVTKKEAFNYLEKDLQDLIRSCTGDNYFCEKCFKCKEYKFYLIK
jgi:hypothetical protein